jgi:short-subunit dehydrogenase
VAVLARTASDVNAVVETLTRMGRSGLGLVADVTRPGDAGRAVQRVLTEFSALDVLVNNAGMGIRKPFAEMSCQEIDRQLDLNLRALINCTRSALEPMRRRGSGCIVNIASRAGRSPEPEMAVYSATKAAVIAFSRALAQELDGSGVRVVAVCPGPVDTERMRQQRPDVDRSAWLTPQDVGQAVVFLASTQSARYNGAVLDLFC